MFNQSIKHRKSVLLFFPDYLYIIKQMKKPKPCITLLHSRNLTTLQKCIKHSPAARVFYISLVFSNASRALSQCNTRLRLLFRRHTGWQTHSFLLFCLFPYFYTKLYNIVSISLYIFRRIITLFSFF